MASRQTRELLGLLLAGAVAFVVLALVPGMDGLQAVAVMRARGDRTPVVALTANAFEEDRRACLDAGMDDFLTKPLDADSLRAAVARWTRPAMQDRLAG